MKKPGQMDRLHLLHEQLLHKWEVEQSKVSLRVQEEQERLSEIHSVQTEVGTQAANGVLTGAELLAWSDYRQELQRKADTQASKLVEWEQQLFFVRTKTVEAYQDSKRWERLAQSERLRKQLTLNREQLKSADELAVTRGTIGTGLRGTEAK